MRLCGQLSWASISYADRDLVSQDFSLVLFPSIRLCSFARERRRGATRAGEETRRYVRGTGGEERRRGATRAGREERRGDAALRARDGRRRGATRAGGEETRRYGLISPERSKATLPTNSGASEAMHASRRSARGGVQPTARKYVELADFGTIRSRSSNEMEAHDKLTEQAHAFRGRSAGGPASPAERAQT